MLFLASLLHASPPSVAQKHPPLPEPYYSYVVDQAVAYRLPLNYVLSLIWAESKNNPKAENWNYRWRNIRNTATGKWEWKLVPVSWDRGFFQLNQTSLPDFSFRYNKNIPIDAFNWKLNIRIGMKHLAVCREATGSMFGAICAMNMGITGYQEWRQGKREMGESTKRLLEAVFQ